MQALYSKKVFNGAAAQADVVLLLRAKYEFIQDR